MEDRYPAFVLSFLQRHFAPEQGGCSMGEAAGVPHWVVEALGVAGIEVPQEMRAAPAAAAASPQRPEEEDGLEGIMASGAIQGETGMDM